MDGNSKFGTLVLVSNPIRVSDNRHLFQNGRTLISLKSKHSWFPSFSLCPRKPLFLLFFLPGIRSLVMGSTVVCSYGIEGNEGRKGLENRENSSHHVIK